MIIVVESYAYLCERFLDYNSSRFNCVLAKWSFGAVHTFTNRIIHLKNRHLPDSRINPQVRAFHSRPTRSHSHSAIHTHETIPSTNIPKSPSQLVVTPAIHAACLPPQKSECLVKYFVIRVQLGGYLSLAHSVLLSMQHNTRQWRKMMPSILTASPDVVKIMMQKLPN